MDEMLRDPLLFVAASKIHQNTLPDSFPLNTAKRVKNKKRKEKRNKLYEKLLIRCQKHMQ